MRDTRVSTKNVTVTDLAREAGVSRSTVSLVLRDSPLVKPETRRRVSAAIDKLGYVYNRSAANLRRRVSNTVGMIIHDLTNPYFAELAVGIEEALGDAGYVALLGNTADRLDRQARLIASMREHGAAGLILCPALGTDSGTLKEQVGPDMPVILALRELGDGAWDFVRGDNAAGTYDATRHLIGLGHRHIAFVGGYEGTVIQRQRLEGYLKALAEAGLKPPAADIISCAPSRAAGIEILPEILSLPERPSAVVCYNDAVAFGVMSALDSRGLRSGRDLAVVGFDDVIDAAHTFPPLTTVAVGARPLGAAAARLFLDRLRDPGGKPRHFIAPARLVVRASCGAQSPEETN